MSKIKNGGLDQYGAGPSEQQQFGTAGIEGINIVEQLNTIQHDDNYDNIIMSSMWEYNVLAVASLVYGHSLRSTPLQTKTPFTATAEASGFGAGRGVL